MTRSFVIAVGCQARDWVTHTRVIDYLNSSATSKGAGVWTYTDKAQNLDFEIHVVYTKAEFKAALDASDAIVAYDGHSRFGQGPAFGPAGITLCPDPKAFPVNPWSDNFLMGYAAVKVPCIDDIFDHCTNPAEIPKGVAGPNGLFISSDVRSILEGAKGKGKSCRQAGYARRAIAACYSTIAAQTNGRGVQSLKTRDYWYATKGETEFHTIIDVGSADLDATSLRCSVLFMNSCSSKDHYYAALQRRKRAAGSKCVFYLTNNSCSAATTVIFLRLILGGYDPLSKRGSAKILRKMNGEHDAGMIEVIL